MRPLGEAEGWSLSARKAWLDAATQDDRAVFGENLTASAGVRKYVSSFPGRGIMLRLE